MNDLLKLALEGHGGARCGEQYSRFRASVSIIGAIWSLKGKPGLLDSVALASETCGPRLMMVPVPQPGRHATWEPYRQAIQATDGVLAAGRRDPAAHLGDLGAAAS